MSYFKMCLNFRNWTDSNPLSQKLSFQEKKNLESYYLENAFDNKSTQITQRVLGKKKKEGIESNCNMLGCLNIEYYNNCIFSYFLIFTGYIIKIHWNFLKIFCGRSWYLNIYYYLDYLFRLCFVFFIMTNVWLYMYISLIKIAA